MGEGGGLGDLFRNVPGIKKELILKMTGIFWAVYDSWKFCAHSPYEQ